MDDPKWKPSDEAQVQAEGLPSNMLCREEMVDNLVNRMLGALRVKTATNDEVVNAVVRLTQLTARSAVNNASDIFTAENNKALLRQMLHELVIKELTPDGVM